MKEDKADDAPGHGLKKWIWKFRRLTWRQVPACEAHKWAGVKCESGVTIYTGFKWLRICSEREDGIGLTVWTRYQFQKHDSSLQDYLLHCTKEYTIRQLKDTTLVATEQYRCVKATWEKRHRPYQTSPLLLPPQSVPTLFWCFFQHMLSPCYTFNVQSTSILISLQ
jgi:hypothetical protein